MPQNKQSQSKGAASGVWAALGLAAVLSFFLVSGLIALSNVQMLRENNQKVIHTHEVLMALDELLSTTQDAETGQRGFLLTGDNRYLEPYEAAVSAVGTRLDIISTLTRANPVQQGNLTALRRHIDAKLTELRETVALRQTAGVRAALAMVATDHGKVEMDAIRGQIEVMRREEVRLRAQRLAEMDNAYAAATASGVLASLFGAALTVIVFVLLRRDARTRAHRQWMQAGQVGLANAMMGDKSVEQLSESILQFLSDYLGFQAAAAFASEGGRFSLTATLGVPEDADIVQTFRAKEGLLGQAAAEGRIRVVRDIPDGYLTFGSAMGRHKPRHLLFAPTHANEVVNGVIELGFLNAPNDRTLDFLNEATPSIGVALRSARYRVQLQTVLEETQRQAEELQVQSEELRVSNEELEEQGRALKESQVRLEQQQVELEQTNSQLEEQAQTLEAQRDELERSGAAVELKARELEQASQYKSDFLANMSHELRTPLNSLLILSKLLGDNAEGNLSPEQIKFARTIQASGADLLTLINDILDLSKIEAGHLQIQPENVPMSRLVNDIKAVFEPIAGERKLDFQIKLAKGAPTSIETDRQRLEQILKNLLSNAFKFTERGGVTLTIGKARDGAVALAVRDTGIGISAEQQRSIFDAFKQADGTISRRYGGTGLGLSISRELARLLGGTIALESTAGEGSTFTVTIPAAYDPAQVAAREAGENGVSETPPAPAAAIPARTRRPLAKRVDDDREALTDARRLLLVIEDDDTFAAIVRDLAREAGFQCLVAGTAQEALELARTYKPSAVVLDLGLPDQSGLTVLDRLKRDDATRHIPIHVVSGADHSQTALSLGAVGYLLKPVQRDELADVLEALEAKLTTTVRRVLIVEDDEVQREAVAKLLGSRDVRTVGAGTAAECLERLRTETFDCMVLDLTLPDASGFSLLETLSEGGQAFPPVIVYTGHDLSPDDEQRLRRYSNSIIIKGAKSPERLLDEVSLFLHQVVADLPPEQQKMIQKARNRDAVLEGRRILIVEDDIRNVYSLTSVLEPRGAIVQIARNGQEAVEAIRESANDPARAVDLVLMDVMMPVKDGLAATREIRSDPQWSKLPIIMLTAKAMPDDHERCIEAGANDYMAKPIDIDKLLSLVRVWMPR